MSRGPKKLTKGFYLRLSPSDHELLKKYAKFMEDSISRLMRESLPWDGIQEILRRKRTPDGPTT